MPSAENLFVLRGALFEKSWRVNGIEVASSVAPAGTIDLANDAGMSPLSVRRVFLGLGLVS